MAIKFRANPKEEIPADLLGSMIVDEADPGQSIAELEAIGEEKLRTIVT